MIGGGGHGREALAIARAADREVLGVLDDGSPDAGALDALGVPHLGGVDWLTGPNDAVDFVAAIGRPAARRAVVRRVAAHATAATMVHPSGVVGPDVTLAAGVILWPHAVLTTRVRVGQHSHVNVAASLSHDVAVGDFVTVGPGARVCGAAQLGDDVWVGAGATIIEGVRVGAGATVGAGAVVIRDVAPGAVVVGVPAAQIRSRDSNPGTGHQ